MLPIPGTRQTSAELRKIGLDRQYCAGTAHPWFDEMSIAGGDQTGK